MSHKCPNFEGCPIYSGVLKGKETTTKAYIKFYCDSENHPTCKRYQVKIATGKCPPDVLPNSVLSVEEIIDQYNMIHK